MNAILSFLAENIFVVVLVIGFVLSLLRKASGSLPRMPDFGGGGPGGPGLPVPRKHAAGPARPARGTPEPAGAQRPGNGGLARTSPFPTAQRSDREMQRFGETAGREGESGGEGVSLEYESARPGRQELPPAGMDAAAPAEGLRAAANLHAPEGDELRRAVLWAEILGPPRAKRPLRRP